MFDRIVHANDGSRHAFDALTLALAIARQNKSELHIVCVREIPYLPESITEVREAVGSAADKIEGVFQQARVIAKEATVALHTHAIAGHPVRDIIRFVADLKADLLVIGARGHSAIYERMIGSRADRIAQLASCPVLVVKRQAAKGDDSIFKRILNANDGSEHAMRALKLAIALARQNKSELHAVCVEEVPYPSEIGEENREASELTARRIDGVLRRLRAKAEECGVNLQTHVMKGHPVGSVLKLAEDLKVDLLAVGARGHSALYERMIGSQGDRMMQLASCPVLIAK